MAKLRLNFKNRKGITMVVLIVTIIIMTIIIGGATTLVGNQFVTNDQKIFVQDFITNYNQDILKLSSKYFMGRDGRNARMQSMNYSAIENFKLIDEEKISKRPEWIRDYTKDSYVIVNTVTNIPYIASNKPGNNGKSLVSINGVGVYTVQNVNFEPIDKTMIKY